MQGIHISHPQEGAYEVADHVLHQPSIKQCLTRQNWFVQDQRRLVIQLGIAQQKAGVRTALVQSKHIPQPSKQKDIGSVPRDLEVEASGISQAQGVEADGSFNTAPVQMAAKAVGDWKANTLKTPTSKGTGLSEFVLPRFGLDLDCNNHKGSCIPCHCLLRFEASSHQLGLHRIFLHCTLQPQTCSIKVDPEMLVGLVLVSMNSQYLPCIISSPRLLKVAVSSLTSCI